MQTYKLIVAYIGECCAQAHLCAVTVEADDLDSGVERARRHIEAMSRDVGDIQEISGLLPDEDDWDLFIPADAQ